MVKKILSVLIVIFAINTVAFADPPTPPAIKNAIQKYKKGNYTGCMQDLTNYIRKDNSNPLAYYYLGMAYTKTNKLNFAASAYNQAATMSTDPVLVDYAKKGYVCVTDSANCYTRQKAIVNEQTALDKFVNGPYGNGLSETLQKNLEKLKLEMLRKEINASDDVNRYEFQEFPDYTKKKSENSKPTNEDIVAAIKVLNDAGLNNLTNQTMNAQMMPMYNTQPDINMLFGENKSNNKNNDNFVNMIPYIMAQGQNGQGQKGNISPEALQALMFNSMMPNLDFGSTGNN